MNVKIMNKMERNTELTKIKDCSEELGKSLNGLDKIIIIISESSQNISRELCTLKDFPSVLPNIRKTLKSMEALLNVLNDVLSEPPEDISESPEDISEVLMIENKENAVGKRGSQKKLRWKLEFLDEDGNAERSELYSSQKKMAEAYNVSQKFISVCYRDKSLYRGVKSKSWKNRRITYLGEKPEKFLERGPWCKTSVDRKKALMMRSGHDA